jgi:hypothetical protein
MHNDHDMARRTIKNFDSKYKSFIKMLKAIIAQNKENQVTYIYEQLKKKTKLSKQNLKKVWLNMAEIFKIIVSFYSYSLLKF